ncbi:hypothetical protein C8R47DRAFT_1218522 [Mycena vitilis]|nr:hypothetical protein C8R47DRAFT_1218522 [Mycena vitilis]
MSALSRLPTLNKIAVLAPRCVHSGPSSSASPSLARRHMVDVRTHGVALRASLVSLVSHEAHATALRTAMELRASIATSDRGLKAGQCARFFRGAREPHSANPGPPT